MTNTLNEDSKAKRPSTDAVFEETDESCKKQKISEENVKKQKRSGENADDNDSDWVTSDSEGEESDTPKVDTKDPKTLLKVAIHMRKRLQSAGGDVDDEQDDLQLDPEDQERLIVQIYEAAIAGFEQKSQEAPKESAEYNEAMCHVMQCKLELALFMNVPALVEEVLAAEDVHGNSTFGPVHCRARLYALHFAARKQRQDVLETMKEDSSGDDDEEESLQMEMLLVPEWSLAVQESWSKLLQSLSACSIYVKDPEMQLEMLELLLDDFPVTCGQWVGEAEKAIRTADSDASSGWSHLFQNKHLALDEYDKLASWFKELMRKTEDAGCDSLQLLYKTLTRTMKLVHSLATETSIESVLDFADQIKSLLLSLDADNPTGVAIGGMIQEIRSGLKSEE